MSTVDMRNEVTTLLESLDDDFLAAVHAMVSTYVEKQKTDRIVGYEMDGTPITASNFMKQAEEDLAAVDRGEFTTVEELEIESTKWLERTK